MLRDIKNSRKIWHADVRDELDRATTRIPGTGSFASYVHRPPTVTIVVHRNHARILRDNQLGSWLYTQSGSVNGVTLRQAGGSVTCDSDVS